MNDIYSSSTEATWENDNADLRHDRNNNSNGNTERGMAAKKMEKKDEEKGEREEEEKNTRTMIIKERA